ncbi:MAG: ACP S-malonyltransferase [Thermodesulfobacteriaceae bacterium]|nr:ACP S-malonyltransferase [Thermodesulfobacteriaceae bacterium]MCX8041030.1 ACP S-malonyltransferase [Thermodesulfobacteriaceae bacterium]MDW8135269.1 ACP S-malonyltransferase [Thermodesulfobacterium sp.]
MIALIFPGQGSQYLGMGKEFYENFKEVKELFERAEALTEIPITKLCFEGPLEELTQTQNLQVCLTVVNIACYLVLKKILEKKGIVPLFTSGHSLGEYSSLFSAEILSLEDTLKAVKERGRLMEKAGEKSHSSMYAIIGLPLEELKKIIEESQGLVVISNYNSPKQWVISGENEALEEVVKKVKEKRVKAVKLKVSAGFHSPLMEFAEKEFSPFLDSLSWREAKIPWVSNVTGQAEIFPEKIKTLMKKQITSAVRWIEVVNFMFEKGASIFIEVGPKKVLSGLVSQILEGKDFKCYNVENLETLKILESVL